MVPADQRFEAGDFLVFQVDERLVVKLEFAADQGLAKVEFQCAPRLHQRIHLGLEEAVGAAAVGLGAVQCHVGVLQELIGIRRVGRSDRNADAGADDDLMAVEIEWGIGRFERRDRKRDQIDRCSMLLWRIANSSPPRRARRRPRADILSCSKLAQQDVTERMPDVSLTILKRSRSRQRTSNF